MEATSVKSLIDKELNRVIQGIRLVDGYDPIDELWNLLCPLFGDTRVLQKTGFSCSNKCIENKSNR